MNEWVNEWIAITSENNLVVKNIFLKFDDGKIFRSKEILTVEFVY